MSKTGVVKFFNTTKGFGFVVQDDGGEDLFAHRNNISDDQNLAEGDAVRFDEAWDDMKGKANAQNITGGSGGPKDSFGGGKGFGGGGGKGFGGGGGKGGGGCFTCGEFGHRANECPQGGGGGGKGYGGGGKGDLIQALVQALGGGGGGGGSWGKGSKGKGAWGSNFKVDKSGGELGEFVGTIKSFNDKTNYGFIECEEAGQGDIFLHGDMKKGYRQGHTVKFTCVLNKQGKAVAIDLQSGLKDTPPGAIKVSSQGSGAWGSTFKVDKSGGELGEFTGTIKSFNDKTNYGFIECEEAGQGDVFLHGDMKKGFRQGHKVKFTCILNKDGKAVAIELKSGLK